MSYEQGTPWPIKLNSPVGVGVQRKYRILIWTKELITLRRILYLESSIDYILGRNHDTVSTHFGGINTSLIQPTFWMTF